MSQARIGGQPHAPPETCPPPVVVDLGGGAGGDPTVDLGLVEALARMRLACRRLGRPLLVRGAGPELAELAELLGLGDVLGLGDEFRVTPPGSAAGRGVERELGGQPEPGEESGVDEVVHVVDQPVAQLEHLDAPRDEPVPRLGGLVLGEGGRAVHLDRDQP